MGRSPLSRLLTPVPALVLAGLLLLAALPPAAAAAGARIPATVMRVVDGDTLVAAIDTPGRGLRPTERVRLIGIDCPESRQVPWGPRATARLRQLVAGGPVALEIALQSRDRYGRLLASVWVGPTLIQDVLVREGFCLIYTVPPNVEYVGRLRQAQLDARATGRGIWSSTEGLRESPSAYRRRR